MPTIQEKRFSLPMTATFLVAENGRGQSVAHALDFDLVSVAADHDTAMAKLRFAVKTYIEFGLKNGQDQNVHFPAPKECWDLAKKSKVISMMPPIEIDGTMVLVYENRTNEAVCAA